MRRELEAIADPAERERAFDAAVAAAYERGKGINMAAYGEIDDVIDPADSRRWIATLFDESAGGGGRPGQAPPARSTPGSRSASARSARRRRAAPRRGCSTLTPSRSDRLSIARSSAGIVERDQPAALIAHQVVMVLAARVGALEPRLPVPDRHALDQAVLDQQLEHPVDAGAAGRRARGPQRVLDLDRAQRARLVGQQVDDPLARAPVLEARPSQHLVNVLAPVGRSLIASKTSLAADHRRNENNSETQSHFW